MNCWRDLIIDELGPQWVDQIHSRFGGYEENISPKKKPNNVQVCRISRRMPTKYPSGVWFGWMFGWIITHHIIVITLMKTGHKMGIVVMNWRIKWHPKRIPLAAALSLFCSFGEQTRQVLYRIKRNGRH